MKNNLFTAAYSDAELPMFKNGFAPIISKETTTVILGSFPGATSLKAGQYYAHPRNYFWQLLGDVFAEPFPKLSYSNKILLLNKLKIGLWDVIDACIRSGSLDADIRQAKANNLNQLSELAPQLKRIFFNGKTAGKFALILKQAGYETTILPSSSPAYASLSYAEKLTEWHCLRP